MQVPPSARAPDRAAARLSKLLDYIGEVVRLDERPAFRLADHRLVTGQALVLHRHDAVGLPGLSLDLSDDDGPLWLKLERLKRIDPPAPPESAAPWLEISPDPDREPSAQAFLIRTVPGAEKDALVASGEAREEDCAEAAAEPGAFDVRLRLEDRPDIAAAIEAYGADWRAWAQAERPRRRAMTLYQKLFELAQLADLGGPDEPFELVWGVGLTRWRAGDREVDLPLIERLVEIEIDEAAGAEIRIRPRALPAAVNLRPYEELKVEGAMLAGDAARRALAAAEADDGVSPFRPEDFEPALRACQARLAASGRYESDAGAVRSGDPPPEAGEQLLVTDRWVLFARRRSGSFILRDLETLKDAVEALDGGAELPPPARTLVSGPGDGPTDAAWQPLGNEIGATAPESLVTADEAGTSGDLFFPKPFNDDQIEIVRRLEQAEGLVVQGPPGTGKTHTIANVICHMMATGRRVLVVSHGEPALAVLRSQLPEGVRDLAISITATERDGLRQLETAVRLLQSIVEGLRPGEQLARIRDHESTVVRLRARLAAIDAEMAQIATRQLEATPASGKRAAELAAEVAAKRDRFAWFTDRPRSFAAGSGLTEPQIEQLRALRARLGSRLEHGDAVLPAVADLPDGAALGRCHADLVRAHALDERASADPEFPVRVVTVDDVTQAEAALDAIGTLQRLREAVQGRPWLAGIIDDATSPGSVLAEALRAFTADARPILAERGRWLEAPVYVSDAVTHSAEATAIVARLAAGEAVFGLLAFRERRHRDAIEAIRIGRRAAATAADWAQVRDNLAWRSSVDALHLRWAALAAELDAEASERASARTLEEIAAALDLALVHGPAALRILDEACPALLPERPDPAALAADPERLGRLEAALRAGVAAAGLGTAREEVNRVAQSFGPASGTLGALARELIEKGVGRANVAPETLAGLWDRLRSRIDDLARRKPDLDAVRAVTDSIAAAGALSWARRLRTEPAQESGDALVPADWREAWDWAAAARYLDDIDGQATLRALADERLEHDDDLRRTFEALVRDRTFYALSRNMTGKVKAALMMFATALRRTGKGTGKGAARHRREARDAMSMCYDAIPCWIMPSWRVAEQLPGTLGAFDLVVMDEASQSDIRELPALLRGKKILVVGDDKQVSPSAAFIETAKLDRLEHGFLKDMPFRTLLLPGSSLYDLAKVMFPDRLVMLKEHFRCVEPIVRFSMPFYPEPLVPLRIPTAQERLDPPLVDIYVPDGRREGDKLNGREARVVVDEIKALIADPEVARVAGTERWRSIGVVSLIGSKQAALINRMLVDELGEEAMLRHRVACGDSATFQGNERDVVFLSMVADPTVKAAQTAMHFEQRFNVALSRARDRLVLVRSVREEELNPNDLKARVIRHFREPMAGAAAPSGDVEAACESDFERALMRRLVKRGYRVRPQVGALGFRIDLVVEGADDRRLAIECDGDRYHGPERWADDMRRQRTLERVGWRFWRCWASSFALDPDGCEADLLATLDRLGIEPLGSEAPPRLYTRHRTAAPAPSSAPMPRAIPAKNGAGIEVGDRAAVRFLDDDKVVTLTVDGARHDPVNGVAGADTPIGGALLGLTDEDEGAYVEDGRERRFLVMRVESSGRAAMRRQPG